MNHPEFQCFTDRHGDILVAGGRVVQKGVVFTVGAAEYQVPVETPASGEYLPASMATAATTFVGGSGRNLIASGGPAALNGFWSPGRPGTWKKGVFTLTVSGASDAVISDATDTVAALTTGGAAPAGDFDSTTYGETTYGGSSPFTFTVALEPGGGGSGSRLVATCTPDDGFPPLTGVWTPVVPGIPGLYANGIYTLAIEDSVSAVLADGVSALAEYSGSTAPVGSYDSTAYAATVGGTDPWVMNLAWESLIPSCFLEVNAGDAPTGSLSASDSANYDLASDSAWTLTINSDGTADYKHSGTVMATRASGSPTDPAGRYEATSAGMTAHNGGEPWAAYISTMRRAPNAGVVYVKVLDSSGVLTGSEGPFYAATLPTNTTGVSYVAIAESDGTTLRQLHTGPVPW